MTSAPDSQPPSTGPGSCDGAPTGTSSSEATSRVAETSEGHRAAAPSAVAAELEQLRRHRDRHGIGALRITVVAGLLGAATAAAAATACARLGAAPGWCGLAGLLVGAGILLAAVPWRSYRLHRSFYEDLATLTARVRQMRPAERREPLRLLPRDRDDELGLLAESIHEVFADAIARRLEYRNLQRHMDHNIERETRRATAALQREALTDPLTGLGNRRGLETCLRRLFGEDGRPTVPLAALMIDLDRFKEVNDVLGHDAGDACLVSTAQVIGATLRHDDYAGRLGGDEFVVLLVNLTPLDAAGVARRLAALFVQQPWPHHAIARPTLSVGVAATGPAERLGGDRLLRRADEALYVAKRSGRNGVHVWAPATEAA